MEKRQKSEEELVSEQAESLFRQKVQEMINQDPTATIRPLRYRPGADVWIVDDDDDKMKVKIKKGRAGVYMVELTLENGISVPIVIPEQAILTDIN